MNWRDWSINPPQIGDAFVLVSTCWCREPGCSSMVLVRDAESKNDRLAWVPTGIYRERYWEDTGQWL